MSDQTAIIDAPAAIEFAVASTGRELVPVQQETALDKRADEINRLIELIGKAENTASRHRLRAGQELIEARKQVPQGEWLEWCRVNIKRGQRDIQRLMKIAGAVDPEAAREKERAGNRVSKASSRTNATVSRTEDDRASGNFRPLGPRIRNTISVPEKPDGETRSQKAKRLFLHFASEDIDVCNRLMCDLALDQVDDISDLRSATRAVIEAWEKIDAALAKLDGAEARAVKEAKAAGAERLKLLRERVEKNGYRLVRRGSEYRLTYKDGGSPWPLPDLDHVEWKLDVAEGKIANTAYTFCGMPIPNWNNSEAWLAAHPGKTMEDFERALPPAPSGCGLAEQTPAIAAAEVEAKADVFRRDFRTRELAQRAAVVAGLIADEFDVEIDCYGCWRVCKPEEAERNRLAAEQDLADLQRIAAASEPPALVIKKATKRAGAVTRPDLAAFAAGRGYELSPKAPASAAA